MPRNVAQPIDLATERRPAISVGETAATMAIGLNQAYAAIAAGEIPSFRVGGRILVPTAALRRLLHIPDAPEAA